MGAMQSGLPVFGNVIHTSDFRLEYKDDTLR